MKDLLNTELSIIITVHNSQRTLRECLTSILSSDHKGYEIIVVDDESTDSSVSIAKEFPCRIISLKKNRGAAAARNRGALDAKNDILLFIDSDIVVKKDSISKIVGRFLTDEDISGVSGIYSAHNRFTNFLSQYKHMITYYRGMFCGNIEDSFRAFFLAVRREIFKINKFDESFNSASIEDIEFGRELIISGYKFILDKTIEVEHIKKFTVKSYFKNQYVRSKDIIKNYLNKKTYGFYFNNERKNKYAKIHCLRVPISWAAISFLAAFFITQNYIFLYCICTIVPASIILEGQFLKFCIKKKGWIFVVKCVMIYFADGLVSSLGIIKGIAENYFVGTK